MSWSLEKQLGGTWQTGYSTLCSFIISMEFSHLSPDEQIHITVFWSCLKATQVAKALLDKQNKLAAIGKNTHASPAPANRLLTKLREANSKQIFNQLINPLSTTLGHIMHLLYTNRRPNSNTCQKSSCQTLSERGMGEVENEEKWKPSKISNADQRKASWDPQRGTANTGAPSSINHQECHHLLHTGSWYNYYTNLKSLIFWKTHFLSYSS